MLEPDRRKIRTIELPEETDGPPTPAPPASPEHDTAENPEKAEDVHGHPETPA
jgi:hypothetical protein